MATPDVEAMELGMIGIRLDGRMTPPPGTGWLCPKSSTEAAAATRGIVKAASWSDFETCVANYQEAVKGMAGNKAEAVGADNDLNKVQAEVVGAVKKKKRVSERCIRALQANPPRLEVCFVPAEIFRRPPQSQVDVELRESMLRMAAALKMGYDQEMDILNQVATKGYAEVDDDDDE